MSVTNLTEQVRCTLENPRLLSNILSLCRAEPLLMDRFEDPLSQSLINFSPVAFFKALLRLYHNLLLILTEKYWIRQRRGLPLHYSITYLRPPIIYSQKPSDLPQWYLTVWSGQLNYNLLSVSGQWKLYHRTWSRNFGNTIKSGISWRTPVRHDGGFTQSTSLWVVYYVPGSYTKLYEVYATASKRRRRELQKRYLGDNLSCSGVMFCEL